MAGGFDNTKFSIVPFVTRVEKPWGYEIIYTKPEALATGKILHVNAGRRLSLQYHDVKVETLCLIKGEGMITLSNENDEVVEIPMEPLKGYFVTPGQVHRIRAITDMEFIEASTPETGNTFRLEDDAKRPTETEEMRKQKDRGWTGK